MVGNNKNYWIDAIELDLYKLEIIHNFGQK